LSNVHNWKSPGSDQIHNNWLKAFSAAHRHITQNISAVIQEPQKVRDWLTTGITYWLLKSEDSKEVRNYQPITCLKTTYKTLTGIRARRIPRHLEEQNGCYLGSKGCKDKLIVSSAIYEDCRRRKKNLSIAWIDYQKAFDSVSPSWLEKSRELVGVNSKIVRLCEM
jgi:hypothetical protein